MICSDKLIAVGPQTRNVDEPFHYSLYLSSGGSIAFRVRWTGHLATTMRIKAKRKYRNQIQHEIEGLNNGDTTVVDDVYCM